MFWNFSHFVCFNGHLGWQVHRLVIVDKDNRCIGVLSLSDILKFLVLRPLGECSFVCLFVTLLCLLSGEPLVTDGVSKNWPIQFSKSLFTCIFGSLSHF